MLSMKDKRGKPRRSNSPISCLKKRYVRAVHKVPTMEAYYDCMKYYRALRRLNTYNHHNTREAAMEAIYSKAEEIKRIVRERVMKNFKEKHIVKAYKKLSKKEETKLVEVLKKVIKGNEVPGFTTIPTCKVEGAHTVTPVFDLKNGRTFCISNV